MTSNSNKTDLLASLTGETPEKNVQAEQDLFGDIPADDDDDAAEELLFGNISLDHENPLEPPQNPLQVAPVPNMPVVTSNTTAAAPQPAPAPSLLAGSGLLGNDATPSSNGLFAESSNNTGSGLFDAVDEQLEQEQQKEAQRLANEQRQQEALRLQQEQEQQRAAQEEILAHQMNNNNSQSFLPLDFIAITTNH